MVSSFWPVKHTCHNFRLDGGTPPGYVPSHGEDVWRESGEANGEGGNRLPGRKQGDFSSISQQQKKHTRKKLLLLHT